MHFEKYEHAQVVNKRDEQGTIISIDDQYTVVEYEEETKKYQTSVCFRSFLSFLDESLERGIKDYLDSLDAQETKKQEAVNKAYQESIQRTKFVKEEYERIRRRASVFAGFFGIDYKYKPMEKFSCSKAPLNPRDYWRIYDDFARF